MCQILHRIFNFQTSWAKPRPPICAETWCVKQRSARLQIQYYSRLIMIISSIMKEDGGLFTKQDELYTPT